MEQVVCALCGKNDTAVLARRGIFQKNGPIIPFTNVVCLNDGLVYRTPRETAAELAEMYKKTYIEKRHSLETADTASLFAHGVDQQRKGAQVAEFLKDVLSPSARVLDVGSGLGLVGGYLRQACGVSVLGVEPSALSSEVARREFGIEVFSGTLDEFVEKRQVDQLFDCVLLHHVFEHFSDPKQKLHTLERLLAPRGMLYIEVPNVLDFQKSKSRFFDLLHLYNYAPETLFALLAVSGFTVIKWNRDKKWRIQIVAVRTSDGLPAVEVPVGTSPAVAERIIRYHEQKELSDFFSRLLEPIYRLKFRLFH